MLRTRSIAKAIAGSPLFSNLSLVVNPGECLGVIGPNGSGKTTLLRILAGELAPDAGAVEPRLAPPIPMVGQALPSGTGPVSDAYPRLFAATGAESQLASVAGQLAAATDPADIARLGRQYDALLARVSAAPGADHQLLRGIAPGAPLKTLSGGELARLALASVITAAPPVLLLDEPTNHLDIDAIHWLERTVRDFPNPVVAVSHDRAFLDAVATTILVLDPASGGHELIAGNYTSVAEGQARRRERQWQAFHREQRKERALKEQISAIESRGRNIENRTIHFYFRKRAAKVARRAVTLKARLQREHEQAERAQRPSSPSIGFRARLEAAPSSARVLLQATGIDLHAGDRRLLHNATFSVARGDRIALVGPNGAGKTTLLRAIRGEHPVSAGQLNATGSARIGALAQDDGAAFPGGELVLTPVAWLQRHVAMTPADAANELHRFLGDHRVLQSPIRALSHGERRRLALARLILRGANLLLLDEPTNHLDIPAREAFESLLADFDGAVILATHDRYLIERFAVRILAIEDGQLSVS